MTGAISTKRGDDMSDFKCQFCGSNKLKYEKPYVELDNNGEYTPPFNYCCKAQESNQKYAKKMDVDVDEVGKL